MREKGRTHHMWEEWKGGREQKQEVGVSLIQYIDYILQDGSCLGYLRISSMSRDARCCSEKRCHRSTGSPSALSGDA